MKVSSEKVAAHRAALIETAKRLMQERGFGGACVADISREAGLTQGALYGHFRSKDALAAEAVRKAFADGAAAWIELRETSVDLLRAYLDAYLCESHLSDVGSGCLIAACLSEVRRQDAEIGGAFTDGIAAQAELVQAALPPGLAPAEARSRSLTLICALFGAVAAARAVKDADPKLAKEIVAAARVELEQLANR